jgi:hypothetical protein
MTIGKGDTLAQNEDEEERRRLATMQSEQEKYRKRQERRRIVDYWKAEAKAVQDGYGILQKEARREAMKIIEDAARTKQDYENINILWDEAERIEAWRIDKHTREYTDELSNEYELPEYSTVIPQPIDHVYWRKFMSGKFLDIIYDCPHDIQEMTSSRPVYDFTKELDESHKEILYYWAIRLWTPKRIAALRNQTDRNIRKVYNKMIWDIRCKMFKRLYPRYEKFLPLTVTQVAFIENGIGVYGSGEIRRKDGGNNKAKETEEE